MVSQLTPVTSPPTPVHQPNSCITQLSQTFEGHHDSIFVVATLPNTQRMVTSWKDKTLYLSDLTTKKVLKRLVGHPSNVSGLAVSRNGKFIASCDITGGIIPWNEEGVCLINDARGAGFTKTKFTAQNGSTTAHNGSTTAHNGSTTSHSGSTTPHNGSTTAHNGSTTPHNGSTTPHNGSTTAHNGSATPHNGSATPHNGSATPYNGSITAQTGESVARQLITAHQSSEVYISLDFSADETTLASAGDRVVKFWCTTTWKEREDAIHLDAVVHCVRYSSSGERLAIATENNICIYNSATRQRIETLSGHSGGTFTLTWTLRGTYLLSGGGKRDPTIRVWDALNWNEIDTFRGHTDNISAIAVDESSTLITSTSCDSSVRLWPFPNQSNILEVSAGAFCVTFFSGGDDRKISQWVLPSTGLVLTKTQVTIVILDMSAAARTACISGDLSTAVEIFTQETTANSSNYVCFGHRSIIYARMRDWESALKDAIHSISIQKSSIGYMSKGIAHYGMGQIREASISFDLALRLTTGDSATHHLLFLIKAIATFNTNAHEEAIMSVNNMAEVSLNADLLTCQVVQIYFYAEMALAASKSNIHDKAMEYIDSAIEIANSCSLQTMDFSICAEFIVIFGWDLKSLWHTVKKYKCFVLFRTCSIKALEYYLSLMEECDKAQKASLRAWFAEEAKEKQHVAETQSATEARARETTEDEAKKAISEIKVAEANAGRENAEDEADKASSEITLAEADGERKNAEDEATEASSERKLTEASTERNTEVGSAADDETRKKIKKSVRRLTKNRRCSQGYVWIPASIGFFSFLFFFCIQFYSLREILSLGHSLMGPLVSHFASLELQMPWCEACPHLSAVPASPSTGLKCTGGGNSISSEGLAEMGGSDGSNSHHQRIAYEIMFDYC